MEFGNHHEPIFTGIQRIQLEFMGSDACCQVNTLFSRYDVQLHIYWSDTVLQAGFSFWGYALNFTVAHIIGGLGLFIFGFILVRQYNDNLMAMLMATLLSLFAAAGIGTILFLPWVSLLLPD